MAQDVHPGLYTAIEAVASWIRADGGDQVAKFVISGEPAPGKQRVVERPNTVEDRLALLEERVFRLIEYAAEQADAAGADALRAELLGVSHDF